MGGCIMHENPHFWLGRQQAMIEAIEMMVEKLVCESKNKSTQSHQEKEKKKKQILCVSNLITDFFLQFQSIVHWCVAHYRHLKQVKPCAMDNWGRFHMKLATSKKHLI